MGYKSELQGNNADLRAILETVNALPEAGGPELILESVEVTPTGKTFTITPDEGVDGFDSVTVEGDANLTPENIAEGVTIYGVEGSMSAGVDTSDATAIAANILKDRTAYVKGEKLTGTMGLHEDAETVALNCGESFQIIGGYHTGGKITANSLASQTNATAGAGDIASGKTAWVNGSKVTGSLTVPTGLVLQNTGKRLSNRSDWGTDRFWDYMEVVKDTDDYLWFDDSQGISGLTPYKPYFAVYNGRIVGYGVAKYSDGIYIMPVGDIAEDDAYEDINPYNIYLYTY